MRTRLIDRKLSLYDCRIRFRPYRGSYLHLTARVLIRGERAAVAAEFLLVHLPEATQLVVRTEDEILLKLGCSMEVDDLAKRISLLMQGKTFR